MHFYLKQVIPLYVKLESDISINQEYFCWVHKRYPMVSKRLVMVILYIKPIGSDIDPETIRSIFEFESTLS